MTPNTIVGVYCERGRDGVYEVDVVSAGGLSQKGRMPAFTSDALATAVAAITHNLSMAYASEALDSAAATPGRIVVPGNFARKPS